MSPMSAFMRVVLPMTEAEVAIVAVHVTVDKYQRRARAGRIHRGSCLPTDPVVRCSSSPRLSPLRTSLARAFGNQSADRRVLARPVVGLTVVVGVLRDTLERAHGTVKEHRRFPPIASADRSCSISGPRWDRRHTCASSCLRIQVPAAVEGARDNGSPRCRWGQTRRRWR